jgi:predicted DNA-binding transcriptional regulator AlpA
MHSPKVASVEPTVTFTVNKFIQILDSFSTATTTQRENTKNLIRGLNPAAEAAKTPVVTQREPKTPQTLVSEREGFITSKVVAQRMGVTRWRILQLVKEARSGNGTFPYYRVSVRSYRFLWSEVDAWLAQKSSKQMQ